MPFWKKESCELDIKQVVFGMVTDGKVVTDVPGYDFKINIQAMTREEEITAEHQVLIPSGGLSMGDLRLQLFGKFVVTALDEKGRGLIPLRGRPSWSEERNVFISPISSFDIYCKQKAGDGETIGVFNEPHRKRFTLPMPPKGWHLTFLTFTEKDGHKHKFLFDGEKEK